MAALIRPNRSEISRRFPLLGFTIRTNGGPSWFEVALTTDPALLRSTKQDRRNPSNFYSSRAMGPLKATRGEVVFLVPPPVLTRFAGQPRLYYALATYDQPDFRNPQVIAPPIETTPYVNISQSFTGEVRSLTRIPGRRNGGLSGSEDGYVNGEATAMVWGGDMAQPGEMAPVSAPGNGANGQGRTNGNGGNGANQRQAAGNGGTAPVPASEQAGMAFDYDDGFDPALWKNPPRAMTTEPFDFNWDDTQLVPQMTGLSCWAAAAAMVVGWRDQISIDPAEIARGSGYWSAYQHGLNPSNVDELARAWGLVAEPPQNYTVDGWRQLLENYGPLWVSMAIPFGHAVVVTGMRGDGTVNGTYVRVLDPLPVGQGSRYEKTISQFVQEYENFITEDPASGTVNVQVLHAPATTTSQGFGDQGQQMMHNYTPYQPSVRAKRSYALAQSFDFNWDDAQLVPQMTGLSCWAAAASMVVGWRDQVSIDPAEIARGSGYWSAYQHGLNPSNVDELAHAWGLIAEPPQNYTVDGWRQLIENYGPLWVSMAVPSGHAVVVTGMRGDGTVDGTYVRVLDPWPVGQGSRYEKTIRQFVQEYENFITEDPASGTVNVQVLHAPAATTSQGMGYQGQHGYHAQSQTVSPPIRHQQMPRMVQQAQRQSRAMHTAYALASESFDFNWDDTQLVAQPNTMSCWAAAAAMVVGWRDQISIDPAEIARGSGYWSAYQHEQGLYPQNHDDLGRAWRLVIESPQNYTIDGWRQLLENNGPLWVGVAVPTGHAVVVTGMRSDGTPAGTYMRVLDPWPPNQGSRYERVFSQFVREYENRLTTDPSGNVNIQVLHSGGQGGSTSQSFGWQQSYGNGGQVARAQVAQTIVPIVSSIAGATMTRVLNDTGDITWELDQMPRGIKYPHDDQANEGSGTYRSLTTGVPGLWVENLLTDRITAGFDIRWQYNGRSLGNIEVVNTTTNDAVGWGLHVVEHIVDDSNVYTRQGQTESFAAAKVNFTYRFHRTIGSDLIGHKEYTLYGDGTFARRSYWTQG